MIVISLSKRENLLQTMKVSQGGVNFSSSLSPDLVYLEWNDQNIVFHNNCNRQSFITKEFIILATWHQFDHLLIDENSRIDMELDRNLFATEYTLSGLYGE